MEEYCFQPKQSKLPVMSKDTYHSFLLAVGGIVDSLNKYGEREQAHKIIDKIHDMIGLHDPWEWRVKRETMTEMEQVDHDHNKVILLDTLGNAGLDISYEYIVSHLNTTNSQWVKRAAVHNLRVYGHKHALTQLKTAAVYDDNELVRYEAMLQYQAHPLSVYENWKGEAATDYVSKRGIFDLELKFKLEAPGVDWQKKIGSESIGASFGIIMENLMDLRIALLSGHLLVRVHDEAYIKVHLGILGLNLDFFLARICFKGGTEYSINILKDLNIEKALEIVKRFKDIVTDIVDSVKRGVELLKKLMSGGYLSNLVDEFVSSVRSIPETVTNLAPVIKNVMTTVGKYKIEALPPFLQPTKKVMNMVVAFYEKVKNDVMQFYYSIVEAVQIKIPHNGKQMFEAIQDIVEGFAELFDDPKTSLAAIGKGVITIYTSIKELNDTRNEIMGHTFIKDGMKAYWMDMMDDLEEIKDQLFEAGRVLVTGGATWVAEVYNQERDPIADFTNGKQSLASVRQKIVDEIKGELDKLLEPFEGLISIGNDFYEAFTEVFDTIKQIKEAFRTLKEGYQFARTMIDSIFGPKVHKKFPRTQRTVGGDCTGDGFYPSSLGNGKTPYQHDGVDVLAEEDSEVVAPFGGSIMLTDNDNEVMIINSGELPPGSELIITNIVPDGEIQHPTEDELYVERMVGKGDVIGTAAKSECEGFNHLHLALRKRRGAVDPSKYLEKRPLQFPEWKQECDDYKLVFAFKTIKEGTISGPKGRKKKDKTPEIPKKVTPSKMEAANQPGKEIDAIKSDPKKMFSKVPKSMIGNKKKTSSGFGSGGSGGSEGGSEGDSNTETTQESGVGASLNNLLGNIKHFLKNFSIRRVKMGQIIEFLELLDMQESKNAMADLFKSILDAINQKPCENPYQMTEEELEVELMARGKPAQGTREDMVKTLTKLDNSCPLLSFTMPDLGGLYCRMDDMCLGIECCITIEMLDMFQKTFRGYARFDPVDLALHVGFESWKYTFDFKELIPGLEDVVNTVEGVTSFHYAIEDEIQTGIRFDILDGDEVIVKYSLQLTETELVLSFGAGICSPEDTDICLVFLYILEDAVFPLPVVYPNGTIVWPEVNWSEYFSKEAIQKRIKEAGAELASAAVDVLLEQFLEQLGLPQNFLNNRPPCPRAENYELYELQKELEARGLSTDGSREELEARYLQSDITCSLYNRNLTIPDLSQTTIGQYLYFYISDDCMRLDACLDVSIPGTDIKKSFSAYISLDPCNFVIQAYFELWSLKIVLFEYEWGKPEKVKLTNDIFLSFSIDKNNETQVFIIDMAIEFADFFDEELRIANGLEVPMPLCNQDLDFLKNIKDIAKALGGDINNAVFDLLLQKLGVDTIIVDGPCDLPEMPEGCPEALNPENMIPERMRKYLRCSLADNCFGLVCCLEFSFTIPLSSLKRHLSVPFWFKMDPCDVSFDVGIGTYSHLETMLGTDWNVPGALHIGNQDNPPITISYLIDKYSAGFIVDLGLTICIPIGDESVCFPDEGIVLLEQQNIPACNLTAIINAANSNFSLTEYILEKGGDIGTQLSEAALEGVIKATGLGSFLKDKRCDREKAPYSPNVLNWNNRCPLSFVDLPPLPEMVSCHIPEHCTGIYCCVDIPKIGLSIEAYLDIDLCTYRVSGGIEQETFDETLFEYEWGKVESISILGLLDFKFSIKKPPNEKIFVIDCDVGACFDNDGSCLIEVPLMKGSEVPQPGCDMSATINFKEFSLSTMLSNNGLTGVSSDSDIWGEVLDFVSETLGLNKFFLDTPCEQTLATYYPPTGDNGWKDECGKFPLSLPKLPDFAVGALKDSCTAIDCCVVVSWLRRTLQMGFNIDFCDFSISGNLEKLTFRINVIGFEYNVPREETIKELLKIRYTIDKAAKDFILDLSVAVCMESGGPCEFEMEIFNKMLIPIPICNTDMGYKIPHFSLKSYLKDKGQDILSSMSSALIATMLHDTDLDRYLLEPPCDRHAGVYANAVQGWNSECNISLPLPVLPQPEDVTCHVPDYCTGIQCCVYVGFIRRSFQVQLLLDGCSNKVTVAIERLERSKVFLNPEDDIEESFYLLSIIRIHFTLVNLESSKQYLLNMDVSICFEEEDCEIYMDVFVNTYLPKPLCNWNNNFKVPGLVVGDWLASRGAEIMKDYLVEVFLEETGIAEYLLEKPCSRQELPFLDSHDGWASDCPAELLSALPPLSGPFTCYIPEYCSGISCCADIDIISRSFNAYLLLDTCKFVLTVGIEDYKTEIPLKFYKWGTDETFALFGFVRIEYNILNLEWSKEFVVNMKLTVCQDSETCLIDFAIFTDYHLPNIACDGTVFKGVDIGGLVKKLRSGDMSGGSSGNWPSFLVDRLFEKSGAAQFMKPEQCDRSGDSYYPADNGWKSGCSTELPTLHEYLSCYIPSTCMEVNCCVYVPVINRNFNFYVSLGIFSSVLKFGIEQFTKEIILIEDLDWSFSKTFDMFGVFEFSVAAENFPSERKFIVSMSATAFPGVDALEFHQIIADNMILPYKTFTNLHTAELTFDQVVENLGQSAEGALADLLVTQALNAMGVTPYLKEVPCSLSHTLYAGHQNGWTKGCNVNLPPLPSYLRCHLDSSCTSVTCCLEIEKIHRTFALELVLDTCFSKLYFSIENYKNEISIVTYDLDASLEYDLKGFLKLSLDLETQEDRGIDVVTLSVSKCFKPNQPCDQITIFDNEELPKPFCNWTPSYKNAGYVIDNYFSWEDIQNGLIPSPTEVLRYVDSTGVSNFLSEDPCQRDRYPFTTRDTYWNNLCSFDFTLPQLPDPLSCYIEDFCSGVSCCAYIGFLRRGISAYVWVDSCDGRLIVGVDNYKRNISLGSYEFGTRGAISLFGLVRVEYAIDSDPDARAFIVTVDIKLCFKGEDCEFSHTIMDNVEVPYPMCRLDAGFLDPDFSLEDIMTGLSLDPALPLPREFLDQVLDTLGVSSYLLPVPCSQDDYPFMQSDTNWNIECSGVSFPPLPGPVVCHLSSSCDSYQCCVRADAIGRTFYASASVNMCDYKISLTIEKYTHDLSFDEVTFGEEIRFYLYGLVRMSMVITPEGDAFRITAILQVCVEAHGSCLFDTTVLDNVLLNPEFCKYGTGFVTSGFVFENFLAENSLDLEAITDEGVDLFFSTLQLTDHLSEVPCVVGYPDGTTLINGWDAGSCPSSVTSLLPSLPHGISCSLLDDCTKIDCCVNAPSIRKSFHYDLKFDTCRQTIELSIEKFHSEIVFEEFDFATLNQFKLQGFLQYDFRIFDFSSGVYVVDLVAKICFSDNEDCAIIIPVMTQQIVPKPQCTWNEGLVVPDYGIWLGENSLVDADIFDPETVGQLFLDYAVAPYLQKEQCQIGATSWNNECGMIDTSSLPALHQSTTCHISPTCTVVTCCTSVEKLQWSFETIVAIDVGTNMFTAAVEQFKLDLPLMELALDEENSFSMLGMVGLRYKFAYLPGTQAFIASLGIDVCLDSGSCLIEADILVEVTLGANQGSFNTGFVYQDYVFDDWIYQQQFGSVTDLSDMEWSMYLEYLNVAPFLNDEQCSRRAYPFTTRNDRWKNECEDFSPGFELSPETSCYFSSDCNLIKCCFDAELIRKSFLVFLQLDTCENKLRFGVEDSEYLLSLKDYEYSTVEYFDLNGFVTAEFRIDNIIPFSTFVLDFSFHLCYGTNYCPLSVSVLNQDMLHYDMCDMNPGFLDEAFVMLDWFQSYGLDSSSPLGGSPADRLFEALEVSSFLIPSCNQQSDMYSGAENGWVNECLDVRVDLPDLLHSTCHLSSSCTTITCCISVPEFVRSFSVVVDIESGNNMGHISLEGKNEELVFREDRRMHTGRQSLNGLVNLEYLVYDVISAKFYIADIKLTVCLNAVGDCDYTETVLSMNILPKPPVEELNNGPVLDLTSWFDSRGYKRDAGLVLSPTQGLVLLNHIGMAQFLQQTQCSRQDGLYGTDMSGWNTACPATLSPPNLPDGVSCYMSDSCMYMDCCIDVSAAVGRAFHFIIDLDPCNLKLTFKIEEDVQVWDLFDFEGNLNVTVSLKDVVTLSLSVEEIAMTDSYNLDLDLAVCFGSHCLIEEPLLVGTNIAKTVCSYRQDYKTSGFSLTTFLNDWGISPVPTLLPTYMSDILLQEMGALFYLLGQSCDRVTDQKYTLTPPGWNTDACVADITVASLPDYMSCYISEKCTEIECCADIELIGRAIHLTLALDPCHSILDVGIESYFHSLNLLDVELGTEMDVWIAGIFRLTFTIHDIESRSQYLITMTLSVCWEASEECVPVHILENTYLTKLPCDMQADFIPPGFSLSGWMSTKSLSAVEDFSADHQQQLFEDLGLIPYLARDTCSLTSNTPTEYVGWNRGCPKNLELADLHTSVMCNIPSYCTGVECCAHSDVLDYNFKVEVKIQACDKILVVMIERLHVDISLVEDQFETEGQYWLFGVVRVRYQVYNLANERKYLVSVDVSVCYETSGECEFTAVILENVKLPKLDCDWGLQSFTVPGFSYDGWTSENEYAEPLPDYALVTLYEILDLAEYLLDIPCVQGVSPFSVQNGFENDCAVDSHSATLTGPVSCHVPSSCTAVDCCLNSQKLGRTFRTSLQLLPCKQCLIIGIEKYQFTLTMIDYNYGEQDHFWLNGVIRMDFILFNLEERNEYVLNLALSVCLEDGGDCEFVTTIFDNKALTKSPCNLNQGYKADGISATTWLAGRGYDFTDDYPVLVHSELMEYMGLSKYLLEEECSVTGDRYDGNLNGWVQECFEPAQLPDLPDNLRASFSSDCSVVQACVFVDKIKRSFDIALELDSCASIMTLTIERHSAQVTLSDYESGTWVQFYLYGVIRLEVMLVDFEGGYAYSTTVKLLACVDDGEPCYLDEILLDRVSVPKAVCDFGTDTAFMVDEFSLLEWRSKYGLSLDGPLPPVYVNILLAYLGVSKYLQDTPCVQGTEWQNACSSIGAGELETLPDFVSGDIPADCSRVDLCMEDTTLLRNIHFYIIFHTCTLEITVGIEELQFTIPFKNMNWGVFQRIHFGGMFRLDYSIKHLENEKKYLVNADIHVCFETRASCVHEFTVLRDALFEKEDCDWRIGFVDPEFSYQTWSAAEGVTEPLDSYHSNKLLEHLHVVTYLQDDQCSLTYPLSGQWETDECGFTVDFPPLPSYMSCRLSSSCTQVTCCMNVESIGRSFEVNFNVDPCTYSLTVGVENFGNKELLFDMPWGKELHFWLFGLVRVDYKVYNLVGERKFLSDLDISLCLESSADCLYVVHVLSDSLMPKSQCDWNFDYYNPELILTSWYQSYGLSPANPLEPKYNNILQDALGLTAYMSDSCSVNLAPFTTSDGGWNLECGSTVDVVDLPLGTSCHISDCTMVECCFPAAVMQRNVHTVIDIDSCKKKLTIGIEKLQFTVDLLTFKFGVEFIIALEGAFRVTATIDDLVSEGNYMMSLDISVCYDAHSPCEYTETILRNTRLPKPVCDWETWYIDPAFSLTTWIQTNSLVEGNLDTLSQSLLLEELGAASYMNEDMCNPVLVEDQWDTAACPLDVDLPGLSGPVSCALDSTCTGITCCMESVRINRAFQYILNINACDMKLTFGIEKLQFDISLLEYVDGTTINFYLYGAVRMSFSLEYLPDKSCYIVNMAISICLEAQDDCDITKIVLENALLPILPCNYDTGFKIPGFSLTDWLQSKGYPYGTFLGEDVTSQLLEVLCLTGYLQTTQCSKADAVYQPNVKGWSKTCLSGVSVPTLPSVAACNLLASCTGVDCCVQVYLLEKGFHLQLNIDPCEEVLDIMIERLPIQIGFDEFEMGTSQRICLFGVICIELLINDLYWEEIYIVDMTLEICLETGADCYPSVQVLQETVLPKTPCSWDSGHIISDWVLTPWLSAAGVPYSTPLPAYMGASLTEHLGLSPFMLDVPCDRQSEPLSLTTTTCYTGGCSFPPELSALTYDKLSCYIPPTCTGIYVCADVPVLGRSVSAYVELDDCTQILKIGIENYKFEVVFADIEFGVPYQFYLKGAIRFDMLIRDVATVNVYVVDLEFSLCFESSTVCETVETLFDQTTLYRTPCTWDALFIHENASLSQWLADKQITRSDLDSIYMFQLQEDFGFAAYLQETECFQLGYPYTPSGGWNQDQCSVDLSLSGLPDSTFCYVLSSCTAIDCCVSVELLQSTVHFFLNIDACNSVLYVGIERLQTSIDLVGYEWGLWEKFYMVGVYRMDYKIENLQQGRKFVVSVNYSICFESAGPCEDTIVVLEDFVLPKTECDWNTGFVIPGFDLDDWLLENSYSNTVPLSDFVVIMLVDTLQIGSYLLDEQCSSGVAPFIPTTGNWNKDPSCTSAMSLPTLDDSVVCYIPASCTGISCCVNVERLAMAFTVMFDIDDCGYRFSVGIENLQFTRSLFNFEFDVIHIFDLNGLIKLEFLISDLELERKYLMSARVKVCFSDSEPCDQEVVIFDNVLVSKRPCQYDATYLKPNTSLIDWKISNNLDPAEPLDSYHQALFFEDIQIAEYLLLEPCTLLGDTWDANACSMSLALPVVPEDTVSSTISNTCTGVTSCVHSEEVGRNFQVSVEIITCARIVIVKLEQMEFEIPFEDYPWGNSTAFYLFGAVRVEFSVTVPLEDRLYSMDMEISLCFNPTEDPECSTSVTIFNNTWLYILPCSWSEGFVDPDFSFTLWKSLFGFSGLSPLPTDVVTKFLSDIQVGTYLLDTQCNIATGLYSGATNGWKTAACSQSVSFQDLPEDIATCYLTSCTEFHCCVKASELQRSFQAIFAIDPCSSILTVGIESVSVEISLKEENSDAPGRFYINGFLRLDYIVIELTMKSQYFVSLNISICLEANQDCDIIVHVLNETLLPKGPCDWSTGFLDQNFYITEWLEDHVDPVPAEGETLAYIPQTLLLDDLGLTLFTLEPTCEYPGGTERWTNECSSVNTTTLPELPDTLTCTLGSSCTLVTCCKDTTWLGKTVQFQFNLDKCDTILTVQIETYSWSMNLFQLDSGREYEADLFGVLRMKFTVEELVYFEEYILSVSLRECYKFNDTCNQDIAVLDELLVPIQPCPLERGYADSGFSLTRWMAANQVYSLPVTQSMAEVLKDDLEVTRFFSAVQCSQDATRYVPDTDLGWNVGDCQSQVAVSNLTGSDAVCHLDSTCNQVDCCVNIPDLGTTLRVDFYIHTCDLILEVGIEELKHTIPLTGFNWGTPYTVDFNGFFRIQFTLNKLTDSETKMYVASILLEVCWESSGACGTTIPVLEGALLTIETCLFGPEYATPDFSLDTFVSNTTTPLSHRDLDNVLNELGLKYFLMEDYCDRNELTSLSDFSVITFNESLVTCVQSDTLFEVICCAESEVLQRNFKVQYLLDPCNYAMSIEVENIEFPIQLLGYAWGTRHAITTKGVARGIMTVTNIQSTKQFNIDISLKICPDPMGSCNLTVTLFQSHLLDYPTNCVNFTANNTDNIQPYFDISHDFWKIPSAENFLSTDTSDCPTITLPEFLHGICKVEDCQTITCVIDTFFYTARINLYVQFQLSCDTFLNYKLEKKTWQKNLAVLAKDTLHEHKIGSALKLQYSVSEAAASYSLNSTLVVCTGTEYSCQDVQFLIDQELKKPDCSVRRRRRRRSAESSTEDDIQAKIRELIAAGVEDSEIQQFVAEVKAREEAERESNFEVEPLGDGEKSVSNKGAVKAMGSKNPNSLGFSKNHGHATSSVTVEGTESILNFFDDVNDIAGRAEQIFIVGKGLSKEGTKLLGEQLAGMTIGDLEAMLETNKVDPFLVQQIVKDFIELAKAIVCS